MASKWQVEKLSTSTKAVTMFKVTPVKPPQVKPATKEKSA